MRFTTPSFKDVEGERKLTSPNLMAGARMIGGPVLGALMAFNLVEPGAAAAAAAGLAATDAEGSVIIATRRFPRLQEAVKAFPSRWGRILDPVADKTYAMGIFMGGVANGAIPIEQGAVLLGAEVATIGVTQATSLRRGGELPEVGPVNKVSMVARMEVIAAYLTAQATHGPLHDALTVAGEVGFVSAVALGAGGMVNIWRQGNEAAPQQPGE